jgi:hypothetical protein
MALLGLLSRIRTAFRDGWHDPATRYGSIYVGRFEIKGSRVVGSLKHQFEISCRPPKAVTLHRDRVEVARTDRFEPYAGGWSFSIESGSQFTGDDILKDRLEVFGVDRLGGRSKLHLEGAVQLTYVREAYGVPSEAELTIDFARTGNSGGFVREGWYGAEEEHRWTAGKFSTIELPLQVRGAQYELEIVAWPFVVAEKLESQELNISVDGTQLERLYLRRGHNYISCLIPQNLSRSASILIRFDHIDAARPRDFDPKLGDRTVAIAFKTVKLLRRLGEPKTDYPTEAAVLHD